MQAAINPPGKPAIKRAAGILLGGGVIAYPTEGVFGLGCLADDVDAIIRLLAIKRRDPAKGLILIAADADGLAGYDRKVDGLDQKIGQQGRDLEQRLTIRLGSMMAVAIGIVAVLVRLL